MPFPTMTWFAQGPFVMNTEEEIVQATAITGPGNSDKSFNQLSFPYENCSISFLTRFLCKKFKKVYPIIPAKSEATRIENLASV